MDIHYRIYGLIHHIAKKIFTRSKVYDGWYGPVIIKKGSDVCCCAQMWHSFVNQSVVSGSDFGGFHYAGYIIERHKWCLPSWIWTNASIVRMLCDNDEIDSAIELGGKLAKRQQDCGGWIVRNDYDDKGAIPVLAPNDSAYIANNAFISLFYKTKDMKWLSIARKCADWIIETARPDSLVYTGYNVRDAKWVTENVIVDTGFTGALFSNLYLITKEEKYRVFLEKFIKRYIDLFYIPEKNGFCTSIGRNNEQLGGMFARGQAWALEGLIPAFQVLKDDNLREVIDKTISTLLINQCKNGGWPYNLTRKMMGEDCKAVSVIAKDMMDWYLITKDEQILNSAHKALNWCCKHTSLENDSKGGIFSYSTEGAIVKDYYTSCAFVYASVYAIELLKQLDNAKNYSYRTTV